MCVLHFFVGQRRFPRTSKSMVELRNQLKKRLDTKKPAPLLIVQSTQHNFVNLDLEAKKQYHLFESTPFHWGSQAIDFRLLEAPEDEADPKAMCLPIGEAMAVSGAATSTSLGDVSEGDWMAKAGESLIGMLGGETGRLIATNGVKQNRMHAYIGSALLIGVFGLALAQLLYMHSDCDRHSIKGVDTKTAGGYSCVQSHFAMVSASILLILPPFLLFLAMTSHLTNQAPALKVGKWISSHIGSASGVCTNLMQGYRHLRSGIGTHPMICHFLQAGAEVTCCAHKNPNQVFLADGGHYENLGVIPLLRRKCARIISVDSCPDREMDTMNHMMDFAQAEQGVTFFVAREDIMSGNNQANNLQLQRHMKEFFLPRCAIHLPALLSALDMQLKQLKDPNGQSEFVKEKILDDVYNRPYVTFKALMDRMPGCCHISVDHENKSLVYIYFTDAEAQINCMRLLLQKNKQYGRIELSPDLIGKFKSDQMSWYLPFNALMPAPCCHVEGVIVRVESGDLHHELRQFSDEKHDRFDSEAAIAFVSGKLGSPVTDVFFFSNKEAEEKKRVYKLRFTNQSDANNACDKLSDQDPKCSLLVRILIAPSDLAIAPPTEFGEFKEFKADVKRLKEDIKKNISVNITVGHATTVDIDPDKHNKSMPLAQITVSHKDKAAVKKAIDSASYKLRSHHGFALDDTYRDVLHLKTNYLDRSITGDFYLVKGELSDQERVKITADGTAEGRCCTGLPHPGGVFPLNETTSEAHSDKTFKAYRDFKKRVAADVLKECDRTKRHEATDGHEEKQGQPLLQFHPIEIDWPSEGESIDDQKAQ